jgi:hypothetical protein
MPRRKRVGAPIQVRYNGTDHAAASGACDLGTCEATCLERSRRSTRRTTFWNLCSDLRQCSQTRTEIAPAARRSRATSLDRVTLVSIFLRQYRRLFCGNRRHRLQPCQKQPSTNNASFSASNQKSGRPGTCVGCISQPAIPARTKARRRRTSVERLPRERILDMSALRSFVESLSIVSTRGANAG